MSWLPHIFLKVINKIFFYFVLSLLIHGLSIHNEFQFIIAVVIFNDHIVPSLVGEFCSMVPGFWSRSL